MGKLLNIIHPLQSEIQADIVRPHPPQTDPPNHRPSQNITLSSTQQHWRGHLTDQPPQPEPPQQLPTPVSKHFVTGATVTSPASSNTNSTATTDTTAPVPHRNTLDIDSATKLLNSTPHSKLSTNSPFWSSLGRRLAFHIAVVYLLGPFIILIPLLIVPFIYSFSTLAYHAVNSSIKNMSHFLSSFSGGSSSKEADMEHLYTRCSICFDASHDFCLKGCKDQFCRSCFQRYVTEIVRNSWGLSVQDVTCPVCQDTLDLCEWESYVDEDTVIQYESFNRPFRPMTRTCENCSAEIVCAPQPIFDRTLRERRFEEILAMVEEIVTSGNRINTSGFTILSKFQASYGSHFKGSNTGPSEIYTWLVRDLREYLERRKSSISQLSKHTPHISQKRALRILGKISQQLVSLELRPEKWKELQLLHVKDFPQALCLQCHQSACFLCGESPYHEGKSCTECIHDTIARGGPHDIIASLEWKLENSKRCPNCSVLINRDEGCNKVDCLYCGHKFCWQCLGQFEKGRCAYYRCQLVGVNNDTTSLKLLDDKPEMGVPNIISIQAKWQRGSAMIET